MSDKFDLILQKLVSIESEQKDTNQKLHRMESQTKDRFDTVETKLSHLQVTTSEINNSVKRIEEGEPQDILAILDRIEKKIDQKELSDIQIKNISAKIEDLESDIRLLKKMITN